jgi:integrase
MSNRPMKKESFGTWFRTACRQAGISKSAHGLRKTGATRAANNGATEAQFEAFFGWRGGGMASLYTREANRTKLARDTAAMLLPERDQNIYSLTFRSGEGARPNKMKKPNT